MLRAGCIVLTLWLILNVIPSGAILFATLSGRGHTPALNAVLSPDEVANLSSATLATLDSIAVFANGLNVAFCSTALVVIWVGLINARVWAFWTLAVGFCFAVLAGVGADYMVGMLFPEINLISFGIVAVGLALASVVVFRHNSTQNEHDSVLHGSRGV